MIAVVVSYIKMFYTKYTSMWHIVTDLTAISCEKHIKISSTSVDPHLNTALKCISHMNENVITM